MAALTLQIVKTNKQYALSPPRGPIIFSLFLLSPSFFRTNAACCELTIPRAHERAFVLRLKVSPPFPPHESPCRPTPLYSLSLERLAAEYRFLRVRVSRRDDSFKRVLSLLFYFIYFLSLTVLCTSRAFFFFWIFVKRPMREEPPPPPPPLLPPPLQSSRVTTTSSRTPLSVSLSLPSPSSSPFIRVRQERRCFHRKRGHDSRDVRPDPAFCCLCLCCLASFFLSLRTQITFVHARSLISVLVTVSHRIKVEQK